MKLSKLLQAADPFEIITIVYLCGEKSRILFSGGCHDFCLHNRDYNVVFFQKEKDQSYTFLVQ